MHLHRIAILLYRRKKGLSRAFYNFSQVFYFYTFFLIKVSELTFLMVYGTLLDGDYMNETKLPYYDSDLDYYFIVRVRRPEGVFYAYNHRTLVRSIDSAKQFDTRRSARRCILRGKFSDSDIIKVLRPHAKEVKTAD